MKHGWDEFGNSWMDVHGPGNRRVGFFGVHHIQNAVDRLVTAEAKDDRSQNLFSIGINKNFHEPTGLAKLFRPIYTGS